jgi:CDP-4-dehydro-6-deoxyglucose reductase, E3
VLIAGGTGFAPLKSMLRHALEREHTTRRLRFFWGARRAADAYEAGWLRTLALQHTNLEVRIATSEQDGEWVHQVAARETPDLAACDVYVAGPPELVESVRREYPGLGVAAERIHFDSFDYAPR